MYSRNKKKIVCCACVEIAVYTANVWENAIAIRFIDERMHWLRAKCEILAEFICLDVWWLARDTFKCIVFTGFVYIIKLIRYTSC